MHNEHSPFIHSIALSVFATYVFNTHTHQLLQVVWSGYTLCLSTVKHVWEEKRVELQDTFFYLCQAPLLLVLKGRFFYGSHSSVLHSSWKQPSGHFLVSMRDIVFICWWNISKRLSKQTKKGCLVDMTENGSERERGGIKEKDDPRSERNCVCPRTQTHTCGFWSDPMRQTTPFTHPHDARPFIEINHQFLFW